MKIPQSNNRIDRIPAWITRVTQDLNVSPVYDAVFWNPPQKYVFKNARPKKPTSIRVYEAHGKGKDGRWRYAVCNEETY